MIGNVPGVDRLLVHGWLRGLRDVGGGGAEQRHNETRECVVVLMTPVSGVLYRASAPDRRPLIHRSSRPEEGCFFIDRFFRRFSELRTPRQSLQLGDSESRANSGRTARLRLALCSIPTQNGVFCNPRSRNR